MIEGLKPYDRYRRLSGMWFGDVPDHWSVTPSRAVFSEVNDRQHPDEQMLSVTIKNGVVPQKALLEDSSKKDSSNLDRTAYKLVQPGDLAYNKMRAWQGAIGASAARGIVSPAYVVMRLRNNANVPEYFHQLFRTPLFAKEAERWSYGITSDMWSLRPEHFRLIYTLTPPPAEQAAIVRLLNWANRRLDRAIRAKRKVIALLNEQKQAIIHWAVTRGLDSSVPLKPSGIAWLGDIPQHWKVQRLKFVASDIVDCLHATPRYSAAGSHPAIRTADIRPGIVDIERARRISSSDYVRWTARLRPRAGDILYSREGERFGVAACVPHGTELCISQRMMVFRIRDDQNSEFIMWLLNARSTYGQALQDVIGATAPHVNIGTIKNYYLALPSKRDQDLAVEWLRGEVGPIESALSRLRREIELLHEYHTRLVTDVVTGKLDVRDVASGVSDEPRVAPTEEEADFDDDGDVTDGESVE